MMRQDVMQKLQTVRVQDLTILVLCALAVYLLRVRDIYTLQAQWRKDFDINSYANRAFPNQDEHLPHPVITDLESDGVAEVVVLTSDLTLQVLVIPETNTTKVLPHVTIKSQAQVPIDIDDKGKKNFPVAMETGYLDKYQSVVQVRKQVIIVVMNNWRIFCFDSDLRILWEQQLMNTSKYDDHYRIKSMSVLVTSETVKRGDRGSVVLGGAFVHRSHEQVPLFQEREDSDILNPGRVHVSMTGTSSETEEEREARGHFSTFCLSGSDGAVRWHHLPGDFENKPPKPKSEVHHWKLGLHWRHHHEGEESWFRYTDDLIKHLPYSWSDISDTRLDLAKFRKNIEPTIASTTAEEEKKTTLFGLEGEHIVGYAYGGHRPHSRHEHVTNPNAILVQHHAGVEVLSLATGRPFTMMAFQEEKAAFADIDGDGNIDRVKIDFNDDNCQVEATALQPSISVLFTGPVCTSASWFSSLSIAEVFFSEMAVSEDTHVQLAPVLVKSVTTSSHPLHHLLGHNRQRAKKGYDIISMTSTGRVTSYGPLGDLNWQGWSPARWSEIANMNQVGSMKSSESNQLYETSFFPSITAYSEMIFAPKNLLLSLGWSDIAIIDLKDGALLSQHSLPCQPVASPVVGDFNNDGKSDFIVTCPLGYIGFIVVRQPNYVFMGVLAVTVMLALLLITWCLKTEHSVDPAWYEYD